MRQQVAQTQMIHARIDPKLKESAERVFSKIGIPPRWSVGDPSVRLAI
jgi:antitoxin component of RelBE/YafQ-DinJ toxin-antitoxin module